MLADVNNAWLCRLINVTSLRARSVTSRFRRIVDLRPSPNLVLAGPDLHGRACFIDAGRLR
jgi:hypothetical protein